MKVIYVAGPYRSPYVYQIWENIQVARDFALAIWNQGHVALCPHLNSMFFEGITTPKQFILGTLELMRRCDAVVVLPRYENSEGTVGEIAEAKRLGKPVFFNLAELFIWLESQTTQDQ